MWAAGAIGAFAGFLHAYQLSAGASLPRLAACAGHRARPIASHADPSLLGRLMGRFENPAEAKAAGLTR